MIEKILVIGDRDDVIRRSDVARKYGNNIFDIKEIVISDSVEQIETEVFMNCHKLEKVILGEKLEFVSYKCFANCTSLKTVDFSRCKVLRHISAEAFLNCSSLDNIVMPPTLKGIDDRAFYDCSSLSHCILNDGLERICRFVFGYCADDLVKNIKIPDSVNTLYHSSFHNVSNPEYIDSWCIGCEVNKSEFRIKEGTKCIAYGAFANRVDIKKVILPDSIEQILPDTFLSDSIEEIEIGKGVKYIGGTIVRKDTIKKIYYKGGLLDWLKIKNHSDLFCDEFIINGETLTHLVIPDGVKEIPYCMFAGIKSIVELTLPPSVTVIKDCAFMFTSIKKINGGENVEYIGAHAFYEVYKDKRYSSPSCSARIFYGDEMISYKGFNPDMSCLDFYYRKGITYKARDIQMCSNGFHSCPNPINIFNYYYGTPIIHKVRCKDIIYSDTKICCAEIEILEQLTYQDVFRIFNEINSKK